MQTENKNKKLKKYLVTGIWEGETCHVEVLHYSAKEAAAGVLWSKKKAKLVRHKQALSRIS